ncbi:unnamed protein product, partial [Mesorhabditis belari]|uniref:Uncharacterized protein n=1 Tax=Mesorhabditis belari TaxID=2138241 RepID=A0AAF3EIM3_9BILA
MSDHNKPSSSSSGKDRSDQLLAMSYDEFDSMLKDIDEEELEIIGRAEEIEHLSAGTFTTPAKCGRVCLLPDGNPGPKQPH